MNNEAHYDGFTVGLGKLLMETGGFAVPAHQRDYSWERVQIDQLINDVQQARQESASADYFVGLMVFIPTDTAALMVLDGQQRLATAVILLSAIRHWLKQHGKGSEAQKISDWYIGISPLGVSSVMPRLTLNELNHLTFEEFVVNDRSTADIEGAAARLSRFDTNRRLLDAALHCRARVTEIAVAAGDEEAGARELYTFVQYLQDRVRVVKLVVPNEADAYRVFETLNDRGLVLSALDLVKSYMFAKADRRETEGRLRGLKARWIEMMSALSEVKGTDFLRAFWTSRHGRTRIGDVYPELKRSYQTAERCVALSSDMSEAAVQYAALEIADDEVWRPYSAETREYVKNLKLLGSSAVHPVMLSALSKFAQNEMERLLKMLEVLLVRDQLILGGRTGQLETSCAQLAYRIYTGEVTTASQAYREVAGVFPDDEQFEEAFRLKAERSNPKAVYILRRLEEELMRRGEGEMWNLTEPSRNLTVEHVLPKNPSREWRPLVEADPSIVDDCVHRLGNLCLLNQTNRELGNKPFAQKKLKYAAADQLRLTKQLANYDAWNRHTIEARQREMARLAVSVWRFQ